MEMVLRAASIYVFLLIIFRVAGKHSLAEITTFDFVLLLIIAEATQQGLLGEDFSVTTAFLAVVTLVGIDTALSLLKQRWKVIGRLAEGVPLVIVENGHPLKEHMRKSRVDESDVLTAARMNQGLERMDQIKYAVLERSGGISIIPR